MHLVVVGREEDGLYDVSSALSAVYAPPTESPPEEPEREGSRVTLASSMTPLLIGGTIIQHVLHPLREFPRDAMLVGGASNYLIVVSADTFDDVWFRRLAQVFGQRDALRVLFFVNVSDETDDTMKELVFDAIRWAFGEWAPAVLVGTASTLTQDGDWEAWERELLRLSAWAPLYDPLSEPFFMYLEDRFTLHSNRTIVMGRIAEGQLRVGDRVTHFGAEVTEREVIGIEMFRKLLSEASAGEHVGILLKDTSFDDVERGDCLAAIPSRVQRIKRFYALVHFHDAEACGCMAFASPETNFVFSYSPLILACVIHPIEHAFWPEEEVLVPGGAGVVEIELAVSVCVETGALFSLRYQNRSAGMGLILK